MLASYFRSSVLSGGWLWSDACDVCSGQTGYNWPNGIWVLRQFLLAIKCFPRRSMASIHSTNRLIWASAAKGLLHVRKIPRTITWQWEVVVFNVCKCTRFHSLSFPFKSAGCHSWALSGRMLLLVNKSRLHNNRKVDVSKSVANRIHCSGVQYFRHKQESSLPNKFIG